MIINIRGTSGTGKTTLVRQLLKFYKNKTSYRIPGRKQPLGYVYQSKKPGGKSLAVIGHYETPCGGCDTLESYDKIFELVYWAHNQGYDVIFEGLLVSSEWNRTLKVFEDGLPFLVVCLDIPIEECLSNINKRREETYLKKLAQAKDPSKVVRKGEVNPKNTVEKHAVVLKIFRNLKARSHNVVLLNRTDALEKIKEELNL